MKIQIFQHLPSLPKAGIFCSLPILCVAFRAFIPDRSVSRCFPLPCLSMFRPLVPMHKSAHSVTHPAAPPSHAPATPHHHTRQSQCNPLHIPAPAAALPAQATTRQHQEQRTDLRRHIATTPPHRTHTPYTPITPSPAHQHPPSRFPHRPLDASTRWGSTPTPATVQPSLPHTALPHRTCRLHPNPHSRSAHPPSSSSYSHTRPIHRHE